MHQFVQSAIEAAKQGENNKAIEFLKQALTANPNDVDAWLVLAAVIDDPQRKRQALNRVLKLNPTNQIAREELEKLDREAMGDFLSETATPSTSTPQKAPSTPSIVSTNTSDERPAATPIEQPLSRSMQATYPQPEMSLRQQVTSEPVHLQSPSLRLDKPIVFRYPFRGRVGYFIIAGVFGCIGLFIIAQGNATSLPLLCMGTLFGLAALSNQSSITVSNSGIRVSNLLSKTEIRWNEISSMKSNVMSRKLELKPNKGKLLKISTQIEGYPALIEIIRQKRPDLLKTTPSQSAQKSDQVSEYDSSPSMNMGSSSSSTFTGVKTFSKNFFGKYGVLLLMLPICMTGPLLIYLNNDWFAGIALVLVGLFFMISSLFNVNHIKLESNKLVAETFFHQKEFMAKQIKEISMKTVRSRRGIAQNFVNIQPMEGNAISMAGFPEGEEVIYGTLMEWWNTYKNK